MEMTVHPQKTNTALLKSLANLLLKPFELLSCIIMATALTYTVSILLLLDFGFKQIFVTVLATAAVYSLVFLNKRVTQITLIAMALFAVVGFFILSYRNMIKPIFEMIRRFFEWTYNYMFVWNIVTVNDKYNSYILGIFLCLLITFLSWLFCYKKSNVFIALIIGLIVFGLYNVFSLTPLNPFLLYAFLFSLLLVAFSDVYYKNNSVFSQLNGKIKRGSFVLSLIPICLVMVVTTALLPVKELPIQWEWMDQKINRFYNNLYDRYHVYRYNSFSLAATGFGEDGGKLGGKVKADDKVVIVLESENPHYLRGRAKNYYTGTLWESRYPENNNFDLTGSATTNSHNPIAINSADVIYSNVQSSYGILNTDSGDTLVDNRMGEAIRKIADSEKVLAQITLMNTDQYLELQNNIQSGEENANKYLQSYLIEPVEQKLSIQYLRMKSGTIFTPLDTLRVENLQPFIAFAEDNNRIYTTDQTQSEKYTYDSVSLKPYSYDITETLLRESRNGLYQELSNERIRYNANVNRVLRLFKGSVLRNALMASGLPANLQLYANYAQSIRDTYTQVSDTLPDRVKELAYAVTESAKTDYDKVKAIEGYLSAGDFIYTLSPTNTPSDRDFVDYFLFDQKEGYCTYYASSMCVMLQSIGIPARYVEGFAPSPESKQENAYYISNKNAHAWVEVYFEGFGWVPFEPTPSFSGALSASKYSYPAANGEYHGDTSMYPPEYEDYMRRMMEEESDSDFSDFGDFEIETKTVAVSVIIIVANVLGLVMLFSLVFIVIKSMLQIRRSKKYRAMDPKSAILFHYKYFFKLLSKMGYAIRPGEMPIEYSKRLDGTYVLDSLRFEDITQVFVKAKYSNHPLDDAEKGKFLHLYKDFMKCFRNSVGWFKYFLYI